MKVKEFFSDIKTSIEIKKLNVAEFKVIYRSLDINGKELNHGHFTKRTNSLNFNSKKGNDGRSLKHLNHLRHLIEKYFPEELI